MAKLNSQGVPLFHSSFFIFHSSFFILHFLLHSSFHIMRSRFSSIDTLRGLIMVIMALDHVRDYFHISAVIDQPTNLATTTPALFFTRWITHFCAPLFLFLSGLSAYIS